MRLARCFKSSVTDTKNFHMPTGMNYRMQSGEVCVSSCEGVSRGCLNTVLQMLLFCQPFAALSHDNMFYCMDDEP